MKMDPVAEHDWLMQMIGNWTYESESKGPDGNTVKASGHESVRPLGKFWIISDLKGEMPGGGYCECIVTIGYEPKKSRFVGTWVGTPSTEMFIYQGQRDESGNVLTLDCEGPSFSDPTKTARYKDIYEIVSRDQRLFRSEFQDDKGNWQTMMTGVFTRVK